MEHTSFQLFVMWLKSLTPFHFVGAPVLMFLFVVQITLLRNLKPEWFPKSRRDLIRNAAHEKSDLLMRISVTANLIAEATVILKNMQRRRGDAEIGRARKLLEQALTHALVPDVQERLAMLFSVTEKLESENRKS